MRQTASEIRTATAAQHEQAMANIERTMRALGTRHRSDDPSRLRTAGGTGPGTIGSGFGHGTFAQRLARSKELTTVHAGTVDLGAECEDPPNVDDVRPDTKGLGARQVLSAKNAAVVQQMHDAVHDHVGSDATDEDDDAPIVTAGMSPLERYTAERLRAAATLPRDRRAREAHLAANPPRLRTAEAPGEVPTAWARALDDRQPVLSDITPDMWPKSYDPFGKPVSGWDIALAFRKLQQAEATPVVAAATRPEPKVIYTNGIPDGYATAIAKLKEGR